VANSLRSDRVVVLCVSLIVGAIVFFAFHSNEFDALASGSKAMYRPGDAVRAYDSEWVVEEVLDWYVVPSYRMSDERGHQALVRCDVVDGTPPPD
jgi:hypothetical protein